MAYVRALCSDLGLTGASVTMRPRSVACGGPMLGCIIPAPLSIPAILTVRVSPFGDEEEDEGKGILKERARSLGKVSVVMKACAAFSQSANPE